MRTAWVIRCIMLALGAALAIVLLARGNVVIGGILAALVVCRVVLLVTVFRRRQEIRRRFRARFDSRR